MAREGGLLDLVRHHENLVGVPSYHYEPLFAQAARLAIREFQPSVIALEGPRWMTSEYAWAATCWPNPVVSRCGRVLLPFIPGDSMLEAYRLAQAAVTPVEFVDIWLEDATPQSGLSLGPELMPIVGGVFVDLVEAACPPNPESLGREAHMARRLRDLMRDHRRVLWVGGAAHWNRIVSRLARGDFDAPELAEESCARFQRMRLGGSAMFRMSGRVPWHVREYARDPVCYDEQESSRRLALVAAGTPSRGALLVARGRGFAHLEPESDAPADIGRVLLYARNLALAGSLRQRPTLPDLLTSAGAVIGPAYAGRVYIEAMRERFTAKTKGLPKLSWEVDGEKEGYRCDGRWVAATPRTKAAGGFELLTPQGALRKARHEEYKSIPPAVKGQERFWKAFPADGRDYKLFVEYLLRRASTRDPEHAAVEPFRTGLGDGLDVRATIRSCARGDDDLHVRHEGSGRLNFTNGAIDWVNDRESSDLLQGDAGSGWIDPSFYQFGSASRERGYGKVLQTRPFHMQQSQRDFSLVTLDLPTSSPGTESFYDKVILPLVHRVGTWRDTLYDWLDVMFAFCAGKPFAYYSRYLPSPRIHAAASRHGVTVVHFPFRLIPEALRARNQTFRFMSLSRAQWEALREEMAGGDGAWGG